MIDFQFDDGGRSAAGFRGTAGDCVTRAVAIATGLPYRVLYERMALGNATTKKTKRAAKSVGKKTAAEGIKADAKWFGDLMMDLGFEWTPTMSIGSGTTVHLRADELPKGKLVLNVSKHMCAVIDRVLRDTHDCSREGIRAVYGYWKLTDELAPARWLRDVWPVEKAALEQRAEAVTVRRKNEEKRAVASREVAMTRGMELMKRSAELEAEKRQLAAECRAFCEEFGVEIFKRLSAA